MKILGNQGSLFFVQGAFWVVLFIIAFYTTTGQAQNDSIQLQIDQLKAKTLLGSESQRLHWMDTLTRFLNEHRPEQYESSARETIELAFSIDSTRMAAQHAGQLVYFLSYQEGKNEASEATFLQLKEQLPMDQNFREMGNFYAEGSQVYLMSGRFETALPLVEASIDLAHKANDSILMAETTENLGHTYAMMGDFTEAAAVFEDAIALYQHVDPIEGAYVKRNLAILYSQNGLQAEAKKIREEIIELAKSKKSYGITYTTFYDQAFDEMLHGSQLERLRYLDSAAMYNQYLNDEYPQIELAIAQLSAYAVNGMISKAKKAKTKLDTLITGANDPGLPEFNLAQAQYEYAIGNYLAAARWGQKEYEAVKDTKFYEGIYMVNEFLSRVQDKLGNKQKAYDHLRVYSHIKDSIESVKKANSFAYYQTQLDTEKKEKTIIAQESEIQLLDAQNKTKTQLIVFGGLTLIAISLITFLVYSQQFNLKKRKLQAAFSRDLIKERESQYAYISRELHDSVGQKLMLLVRKTGGETESQLHGLAKESLHEIRSISQGLHPGNIKHSGVSAALKSMIDKIDANTDIFFTHQIENIDGLLTEEQELHFYRIVQESLTNVIKHSEAKATTVVVENQEDRIHATVQDNGKGFVFSESIRKNSLGMKTLLERAKIIGSQLYIDSVNSMGTKVHLSVPLSGKNNL